MKFAFKDKNVYYEVHGEGEPLLVLNGIFMSCASWAAFVPALSRYNRLILVDFLDQGRSDKQDGEYKQDIHVETVRMLLEHLGLDSVNVLGISYGGEVAMQLASVYPGLVKKLVLANTTAYTNPWLEDMGKAWEYALASHDGRQFFKTCIPVVYSPQFYATNIEWARKREALFETLFTPETYDAFLRLIRSAEGLDIRSQLKDITAPTLVISSDHDYVTPLHDQELIVRSIPGAAHVVIKNSGHASMYEKPVEFVSLVLGFVNNEVDIRIV